ncbi:MAG: methyltransferase domain-containing protein, partial [Phycisphaerae bacterium]|nr:methyltransferase domain-containing protein [Phycisphaerae bacterium]
MEARKVHADWPRRQIDLAVGGVSLRLAVPDRPYDMLDLPAVEQAFNDDDYMPYWAHLWPAGAMLADWLIGLVNASRQNHAQPTVPLPPAAALEIGCGLGLAGLFAARLGYRVTLTDYDPSALDYVRENARLNDLAEQIATTLMDWRQPSGDRFPLILAADVLYEQRNHQPIFELLRQSLSPGGVAALSDPCRRVADAFLLDAPAAGWSPETIPAHWEHAAGRIILLRP